MTQPVAIVREGDVAAEFRSPANSLLMRYVVWPDTPANESPRPYAHPVHTPGGELLTNFRPNDHPWHHGLNFTIGTVSGVNFWGGPTYRKADGYQWRDDHGNQRHARWIERGPAQLSHALEWRAKDECLLTETRTLTPEIVSANAWRLRWQSELTNSSGRELALGNYLSREGLHGSHYTGLQFRGARDLLDRHGDDQIGMFLDSGAHGEADLNGAVAERMEWRGQKDTSLRRVRIRFENSSGPIHWFVREGNPLVSLAFQFDRDRILPDGGTLQIDHTLTFLDE